MVKRFLSYVEIKTKITSLFTFLMIIAYLFYIKQDISWKLTLVFFISMFFFDLTTTAINNYIDTKNNHQTLQFNRKAALIIIFVLLFISIVTGLYLAYLTDIVVLLIGMLCFVLGIIYTYGPVPISRQPLGEFFSGFSYGLLIPFILLYINMPAGTFLSLDLSFKTISIDLNVVPIAVILLLSVIPFCVTANIMLANNICDLEKDIAVKRHTLPYYIQRNALYLLAGLYYITYIAVIVMVIFRILSPLCLLALLTIFIVQKNINHFFKVQDKATTFIISIKNFIIIMGSITLIILISSFLTWGKNEIF